MTALANFRHLARGGQPHVQQHSTLPDTYQPGVAITQLFPFQSYFDTTLLEKAILQQSRNSPIVNSTTPATGAATPMLTASVPGYAVGLHPSSQTPVAVQFLVGGQPASPQAVILRPGQIYRPFGKPGESAGHFSGLNWGIPFGWLGGGVATLYVFSSPDADAAWPGDIELIFHRQTMKILAPSGLAAQANAQKNWPLRFPWTQAVRGSTSIGQQGAAIIGVTPTKTLMSLRLNSLATASDMQILVQSSNDFDLDSSGAVVTTPVRFISNNYTWGTYSANGGAGNLGTAYPVVEAPTEWTRLAADDGGVQLVDMSGGTLAGKFVDVVRYGKL